MNYFKAFVFTDKEDLYSRVSDSRLRELLFEW